MYYISNLAFRQSLLQKISEGRKNNQKQHHGIRLMDIESPGRTKKGGILKT